MTSAAELVHAAKAILLDFDGPVTPLMPPPVNAQAADHARAALTGVDIPADVAATTDHLAVLRWTATSAPDRLAAVEEACIAAELKAARACEPTAGALDFLRWCQQQGKPVVIVSNNAAGAITTCLNRFDAAGLIRGIVGREPRRPDLLKPHPSLVWAALDLAQVQADEAVLIGDSVTDVDVALATGSQAIGYAKNADRRRRLGAVGASSVVDSMFELLVETHI
ncbi:HAD family hydrolase [Intrasporangium calvum]|uniref:HAD family hydrolase n=1 Tax=Intrasporangium calvum TaxID=53358 RepID=UPI001901747C|nr:HAD hydrolase-like protein [Intrasporangium calvum]